MAFWFVREVTGSDLLLVTFCFFRKRVKEALINLKYSTSKESML